MPTLFFTALSLTLFVPVLVWAQTTPGYQPLISVPLESQGFSGYVNYLYAFSISIAALLAVVKIVIAGAKYMLSDVIPNKGAALDDIRESLLGLLLIISSVLLLNTINPQILSGGLSFDTIEIRKVTPNPTGGTSSVTATSGGVNKDITPEPPSEAKDYNITIQPVTGSTEEEKKESERLLKQQCEKRYGRPNSSSGKDFVACTERKSVVVFSYNDPKFKKLGKSYDEAYVNFRSSCQANKSILVNETNCFVLCVSPKACVTY